VDMPQVVYIHH